MRLIKSLCKYVFKSVQNNSEVQNSSIVASDNAPSQDDEDEENQENREDGGQTRRGKRKTAARKAKPTPAVERDFLESSDSEEEANTRSVSLWGFIYFMSALVRLSSVYVTKILCECRF